MSTFIEFRAVDVQSLVTKRWDVIAKRGLMLLGTVKWFGPWRKYCFFPTVDTVFEEICLRDIAEFCETATKQHRASKNERTPDPVSPAVG